VREFALTKDRIDKLRCAAQRHFEPDRRLQIGVGWLVTTARAAGNAANFSALLALFGMIAANILLSRAITTKCGAVGKQLLRGIQIKTAPLRLIKWTLIPIDSQPLQTL